MNIAAYIATLALVAHAALGQSTTSGDEPSKPTIRSVSTLVIVPTLVRSAAGDFVTNLDASHFRLSDNGIEQKVFVEQAQNQPLAVVVLMQNGGAASSQLQNYGKLDAMLEAVLGSSTRTVALVTFDSRPKEIWGFPPQSRWPLLQLDASRRWRSWRSNFRCSEVRDGTPPTATGELSPHHPDTQPVAGRRKHHQRGRRCAESG